MKRSTINCLLNTVLNRTICGSILNCDSREISRQIDRTMFMKSQIDGKMFMKSQIDGTMFMKSQIDRTDVHEISN